MLLSSATQAAHRLNARQHHRADDKTQHQVGNDRQQGSQYPAQPRAPVPYNTIVITGLATVSPEKYSLIIRDSSADTCDQFRIYWW